MGECIKYKIGNYLYGNNHSYKIHMYLAKDWKRIDKNEKLIC